MLDKAVRPIVEAPLTRAAEVVARIGTKPNTITAVGFGVGVGACVAATVGSWWVALILWLINRLLDGLDGSLARIVGPTELGGYLDLMADFTIYCGMVVAVAIALPETRLAAVVLLSTYYLSGSAFLAWSSLAERRRAMGDERTFNFVGGVAEGTETIIAYVVLLALPSLAEPIMWTFAALVAITFAQRLVAARRLFGAID